MQHLTQHRDRNASDNSMNTTPADLQITAETGVLHTRYGSENQTELAHPGGGGGGGSNPWPSD